MIIDKILASGLPAGSISAMAYASRLRGLPESIITASILTVVFPLLSEYAAKKEFEKLKAIIIKTISLLFMVLMPVISICIYYAPEITKIVYERGAFEPENTLLTASIFTFSVISLIFSGCANLLNNLFYSIKNTKSPQFAAIIMLIFNVIFNLSLIRYMQASGLALATSIASFIYFLVLFIQFRIKFGPFGELTLFLNILKYFTALIGMIPIFFLFEILRGILPLFIFFTTVAIFSLCVYAILLYFLKAKLFMQMLIQIKIKKRMKGILYMIKTLIKLNIAKR